MAILLVINPQIKLYTRYMLHGLGRVDNDAQFREQLRLMAAILLAHWMDTNPVLKEKESDLFDVVTSEKFYEDGYTKTTNGDNDDRLWFCSYVGFERVTSAWAKKNHPECRGYIGMRIFNQDKNCRDLDSHTIIIYF
jgi:hypothetical protein